jgi:hypothetical protein
MKPRITRPHRLLDLTNLRTLSDLFAGYVCVCCQILLLVISRFVSDVFAGYFVYYITCLLLVILLLYHIYLLVMFVYVLRFVCWLCVAYFSRFIYY